MVDFSNYNLGKIHPQITELGIIKVITVLNGRKDSAKQIYM